jgi:hypothetical protein
MTICQSMGKGIMGRLLLCGTMGRMGTMVMEQWDKHPPILWSRPASHTTHHALRTTHYALFPLPPVPSSHDPISILFVWCLKVFLVFDIITLHPAEEVCLEQILDIQSQRNVCGFDASAASHGMKQFRGIRHRPDRRTPISFRQQIRMDLSGFPRECIQMGSNYGVQVTVRGAG